MRLARPVFLAFVAMAFCGLSTRAADTVSAVFVLDCSHEMGEAMEPIRVTATSADMEPALNQDKDNTRLTAGKEAVLGALDRLSTRSKSRAGLWLCGHRLAWERNSASPDLLEQNAYLEQTMGFNALIELLPGDDAELLRTLSPMEPQEMPALSQRLSTVKPWGESPLFLTLQRALDNYDRTAPGEQRIVVVTAAGNKQTMCKHKVSKQDVLEALERKPVAIHFIVLGDAISRQAEAELMQLAHHSGGNLHRAASPAELDQKMSLALSDRVVAAAAINQAISTLRQAPGGAGAEVIEPGAPRFASIQGTLSYYNKPMPGMKVRLTGAGGARIATSDANGRFSFDRVQSGGFTADVRGPYKDIIMEQSVDFTVDAAANPAVLLEMDFDR